jgi:hypothetical protein
LVSGETLFLVPDIETMPVVRKTLGESTPLQVPGVQLAELAACKHVKVYHPEGWYRSNQRLCADPEKKKMETDELDAIDNEILELNEEAEDLEKDLTELSGSVEKWKNASDELVSKANCILYRRRKILNKIKISVESFRDYVIQHFEAADATHRNNKLKANENEIQSLIEENDRDTNDDDIAGLNSLKSNAFLLLGHISEVDKKKAEYNDYMTSLSSMMRLVTEYVTAPEYAMNQLYDLHSKCKKLAELYEKKEKGDETTVGIIARLTTWRVNVDTDIENAETGINVTTVITKDVGIESAIVHYNKKQDILKAQFDSKINTLQDEVKTTRKEAQDAKDKKKEKERLQAKKMTRVQENGPGGHKEPNLEPTQVPHHGSDMVVAVQVSGELFRIVHFTSGKQEESKWEKEKREKEEEAEEAVKRKYSDTTYAKERRKEKGGKQKSEDHKDVVALDADYDDYLECVSAAKKYIRECGIVNATRTWSSVAWMLTKGPCNDASGAGTSALSALSDEQSMANSFGALEDPGGLELVLVPLSVFGHLYENKTAGTAEEKYTGKMEIYPNGIWVSPDAPVVKGEKGCTKCAACEKDHAKNTGKSGLFVRYSEDKRNVIRGLAKRFCADCPPEIK